MTNLKSCSNIYDKFKNKTDEWHFCGFRFTYVFWSISKQLVNIVIYIISIERTTPFLFTTNNAFHLCCYYILL